MTEGIDPQWPIAWFVGAISMWISIQPELIKALRRKDAEIAYLRQENATLKGEPPTMKDKS